jgi:AAA15 family ATPase/GTPase
MESENNILAHFLQALLHSYEMKDFLPLARTLLNKTKEQMTLSTIERIIIDTGLNATHFQEKYDI